MKIFPMSAASIYELVDDRSIYIYISQKLMENGIHAKRF